MIGGTNVIAATVLALLLLVTSPAISAPLIALICSDPLSCLELSTIACFNTSALPSGADVIVVDPATPSATAARVGRLTSIFLSNSDFLIASNNATTALNMSSSATAFNGSSIPAISVYIPVDDVTSDSAVYLAMLAGIDRAQQLFGRKVSLMIIPRRFINAAPLVASQVNAPYLQSYLKPVKGLASNKIVVDWGALHADVTYYKGSLNYHFASLGYVIAAVATAISQEGSIAIISSSMRNTLHVFSVLAIRDQCSTCLVYPISLPSAKILDPVAILAAFNGTLSCSQADVLLLETTTEVWLRTRRLFATTPFRFVQVLCVYCVSSITSAEISPNTMLSTLMPILNSGQNVGIVTLSVENGGIDLTACQDCLSPRALLAFSDTKSKVQSLFNSEAVDGIDSLLSAPLDIVMAPELVAVITFSGDNVRANFEGCDLNSNVDLTASSYSSVASNCAFLELLREAPSTTYTFSGAPQYTFPECFGVIVTKRLRLVTTVNGGNEEWSAASPMNVSQLTASQVSMLPDFGYSLDPIAMNRFVVFGGQQQRASSVNELVDPIAALLLITFDDPSSPSFPRLSVISWGDGSSSSAISPPARTAHAHVSHPGSGAQSTSAVLYIHGGRGGGEIILQDLWRYSTASNSWTQLPPSTSPRFAHAMHYLLRYGFPAIIVMGGSLVDKLSSVEMFLLNQSAWQEKRDVAVVPSSCSAPIQPSRVSFLDASRGSPCLLDTFSLITQCNTSIDATLQLASFSTFNALGCVMLASSKSFEVMSGLLLVPTNAASNRELAALRFFNSSCPLPTVDSGGSSAGLNGSASLVALWSSVENPNCSSICVTDQFPYLGLCVPCNFSLMSKIWAFGSDAASAFSSLPVTEARARHCSAIFYTDASSTDRNSLFGSVAVSVLISLLFFVCGAGIGYLGWMVLFYPANERDLKNAPLVLPVTLLHVDVHGSSALWRTSPESHAVFLDDLAVALHDAIVMCEAYRVKRVGDGALVACRDVASALEVCDQLRSKLRDRLEKRIAGDDNKVLKSFSQNAEGSTNITSSSLRKRNIAANKSLETGREMTHGGGKLDADTSFQSTPETRYRDAAPPAALSLLGDISSLDNLHDFSPAAHAAPGRSVRCAGRSVPSLNVVARASRLVQKVKFAIHSSSCIDIIHVDDRVEYAGEDALLPVLIAHSTKGGELALTLDAVAELEAQQALAIADGQHLRQNRGKRNNLQGASGELSVSQVLTKLKEPIVPVSAMPSPTALVVTPPPGAQLISGSTSADAVPHATHKTTNERVCLNGTHVRVIKLMHQHSQKHRRASGSDPSVASFTQVHSTNSEGGGGHFPIVNLRLSGSGARAAKATNSKLYTQPLAAAGDPLDATIPNASGTPQPLNPVQQELNHFYDYLDDPDLARGHVTRDEFAAMRSIVAFIIRSAVLSLDPETQESIISECRSAFALSKIGAHSGGGLGGISYKTQVDQLLEKSNEGMAIQFFHRLAVRVLQMMHPSVVKQKLMNCADAGRAAEALGVGDMSATMAAEDEEEEE